MTLLLTCVNTTTHNLPVFLTTTLQCFFDFPTHLSFRLSIVQSRTSNPQHPLLTMTFLFQDDWARRTGTGMTGERTSVFASDGSLFHARFRTRVRGRSRALRRRLRIGEPSTVTFVLCRNRGRREFGCAIGTTPVAFKGLRVWRVSRISRS